MYSIFNDLTGKRVSEESYATAEAANHDYHMNCGETHIGIIPDLTLEQAQAMYNESDGYRIPSGFHYCSAHDRIELDSDSCSDAIRNGEVGFLRR